MEINDVLLVYILLIFLPIIAFVILFLVLAQRKIKIEKQIHPEQFRKKKPSFIKALWLYWLTKK